MGLFGFGKKKESEEDRRVREFEESWNRQLTVEEAIALKKSYEEKQRKREEEHQKYLDSKGLVEFFSEPRKLTKEEAQKDPEMIAALMEFRKAYCACYKSFVIENEYYADVHYDETIYQIDKKLFASYYCMSELGELRLMFDDKYNKKYDIRKDCFGFEYKPFYNYLDGEHLNEGNFDFVYYEKVIVPELFKLRFDNDEDLNEDYSSKYKPELDSYNGKEDPIKYTLKFWHGGMVTKYQLLEFINRMNSELLHGTFPTVERCIDNASLFEGRYMQKVEIKTAVSVPSLANAIYQLTKIAVPGVEKEVSFVWPGNDYILHKIFTEKDTIKITAKENNGYETETGETLRETIFKGGNMGRFENYYVIHPETYKEDCYKMAKEFIVQYNEYSKRKNSLIIDEEGCEGEMKAKYLRNKYVDTRMKKTK